jgi:hypothetical protein
MGHLIDRETGLCVICDRLKIAAIKYPQSDRHDKDRFAFAANKKKYDIRERANPDRSFKTYNSTRPRNQVEDETKTKTTIVRENHQQEVRNKPKQQYQQQEKPTIYDKVYIFCFQKLKFNYFI